MKNELQVYTDELNNYTHIYLNSRLVHKSEYIKSIIRLKELTDEIKKPLDNCEVITYTYTH